NFRPTNTRTSTCTGSTRAACSTITRPLRGATRNGISSCSFAMPGGAPLDPGSRPITERSGCAARSTCRALCCDAGQARKRQTVDRLMSESSSERVGPNGVVVWTDDADGVDKPAWTAMAKAILGSTLRSGPGELRRRPVRSLELVFDDSAMCRPALANDQNPHGVQGVPDGADRRDQPVEHQRLGEMHCSVMRSGIGVMDRVTAPADQRRWPRALN